MGLKKKKKGKTASAVNALSHIVSRRENQMYTMYTIEDKQNNRQQTIYNEWEVCVCVCVGRRNGAEGHNGLHRGWNTSRTEPQGLTDVRRMFAGRYDALKQKHP